VSCLLLLFLLFYVTLHRELFVLIDSEICKKIQFLQIFLLKTVFLFCYRFSNKKSVIIFSIFSDMARAMIALFIVGFFFMFVAFTAGVRGCWKTSPTNITASAVLMLIACKFTLWFSPHLNKYVPPHINNSYIN
jgi:hypothetical protein